MTGVQTCALPISMAAALVAARLDDDSRRQIVADNIMKAVNQQVENDGNSLSLSRTVAGYVIAGDIIEFNAFDPTREAVFRARLEPVVNASLFDDPNHQVEHEVRGNNQRTQAAVARYVTAIYLDKPDDTARAPTGFTG